jgi:hypothetical protein
VIIPSRFRAILALVAGAALVGGGAAALGYHRLGLTLSHYDARGHLIVARRILDSITPGWQQIGAVWLPLPHLLNAVPVQVDWFYRTGASAVFISVISFAVATTAIAWIGGALTGSTTAALVGAAVFALNPNVVYLQATPMTEPLLLALTLLGVALLIAYVRDGKRPALAGIVLALACLTRYEAWPITYAALPAAAWALWRNGEPPASTCRRMAAVAVYPTAVIIAFLIFSRIVVGQWFVSSDFFVPENKALGLPMVAVDEIAWGTRELSGRVLTGLAVVGCSMLAMSGLLIRRRAAALVALSPLAAAAVPWAAFVDGHPFRIRYMVPLVAMEAVAVGALVGFLGRLFQGRRIGWPERPALQSVMASLGPVAAIALLVVTVIELHPLDDRAPMVVEAQWDRVNVAPRQAMTSCLRARYRGDTIMASMGSLGHYMQETSRDGFNVRDFLHEGNGDIWLAALERPQNYAGWLLIEEKAEGGDMLAKRAREHPDFLAGYSRVCEGAGVALYERQNRMLNVKR